MTRFTTGILLIIFGLFQLASCSSGGETVIIEGPSFNTASSYSSIPNDFNVTYEIRDENMLPPYRIIMTVGKNLELSYEKFEDISGTVDKTEWSIILTEEQVLELYNLLVSNGFFTMDGLYTTKTTVPVEFVSVTAKTTDFRVEYHTCPDGFEVVPLPGGFIDIITFIIVLSEN
ncbi:hypothetical protein KKB99_01360 [bacterium]|nr:hypothetical protein [bacterium]MBU1024633.1 hypothetical protein [bacterium]